MSFLTKDELKELSGKARPFNTGLVLAGGGARAAYQVGVLKAVAELVPKHAATPVPVISGPSAGAINGAALAIYATQFHAGVSRLLSVWENFHVQHVFRSDALGILKNTSWWIAAMFLGGLGKYNPQALLDREPLYELLKTRIPCRRIQHSIEAGALHAFGVSASGYTSGQSITFYQGVEEINPWQRARRAGCRMDITTEHLMASSALPLIFSAVKINREYFGDGSMRQMAPFSPALHMGADRLFVIGVRRDDLEMPDRRTAENYPSLAQIAGHALNSIFLDSMETDLERLHRINNTVSLITGKLGAETDLRKVHTLVISPSKALDEVAARHAHRLPGPVSFLFRGVGAYRTGGANLLSYLLFEDAYCRELIAMGYADAMLKKEEIVRFLTEENLD